jgi:hypothetical protein
MANQRGELPGTLLNSGLIFPLTIFLSAFLLFQVQPIIGRYILPWFGGGPAVWTACMLFFQAVLLGGYAYAHFLSSSLSSSRAASLQARFHIALLAVSLAFLPLTPRADLWKPASGEDPTTRIILLLGATVGVPYLLLSATGPLLQRWFTVAQPGESPWRLYALSNLGSFLALLTYPFLVEPWLRLRTQGLIWSALYALFVALCAWTAWKFSWKSGPQAASEPAPEPVKDSRPPAIATILFWLALSACTSALLLGTTNQISQEIAVNPFLWVAPLSLYLLTFILTFESERWYQPTPFALAAGIFAPVACVVVGASIVVPLWGQLALYLAALFVACMLCHGELARARPAREHITAFYLTVAAGGALGGVFVALFAPRIFIEYSEYSIALGLACLLGFLGWLRSGALAQWTSRNFAVRVPLMVMLIGGITSLVATVTNSDQPGVQRWRNFYGILRVAERPDDNGPILQLTHGRIRHGFQYLREPQRHWATSYYGAHSGVGIAINALDRPNRQIAVIGLGTGTLAAWGRPGDTFRFYEINPDVEQVARTRFSYLKDSPARTEVIPGDGRLQLERELASGHSHDLDLIAVDAFSSDSIPLHLLTAECADVYRKRLAPGGVLLLHISNRALDLEPVVKGLAHYLAWDSAMFIAPKDEKTGESSSTWVLISSDPGFLEKPAVHNEITGWTLHSQKPILWTDDFASLWPILRF